MWNKTKMWISTHKKLLIAVGIIIALAVGLSILFNALGLTNLTLLGDWVNSLGAYGMLVFWLLQVLATVFLCFVPGTSMAFILLGVALFGPNWKTFLLCFSGVIAASILMDLLGRFGGSRIIKWLVGEEEYESTLALVQTRGVVYIPVFYLLPMFPDDFICMICGSLRVKWWVHYLEIIACRGIGCATIVFGISVIPNVLIENLKAFNWDFIANNLWDYIVVATVIVFWVLLILNVARKIDKKINHL